MSSKLISTIFISSEHCLTFLISSQLFLISSVRLYVKKLLLSEKSSYTKISVARRNLLQRKAFAHRSFRTQMCLYRRPFTQKSFYTWDAFIQRSFSTQKAFRHSKLLHKDPCTNKMATECTKHFPVLLWATRLAQISSHCTTSLAQSTVLLCTTNGCTKHFPVLLCTTKLARSLPCTTLYYKTCTKESLVLLCTTKLDRTLASTTVSTQTRCPLSYTKKTSSPTHVPCDMHAAIKTRPNYTRLGYTRPHTTQD